MVSAKVIFVLAIVALVSNLQSTAAQGPLGNPWVPQWQACEVGVLGATCSDCNTRLICTKIGGKVLPCRDVLEPYCNAGQCSATPSAECGSAADVPSVQVV